MIASIGVMLAIFDYLAELGKDTMPDKQSLFLMQLGFTIMVATVPLIIAVLGVGFKLSRDVGRMEGKILGFQEKLGELEVRNEKNIEEIQTDLRQVKIDVDSLKDHN